MSDGRSDGRGRTGRAAGGTGPGAPAVRRRSVLGGAALGITTTVLPAATAAASGPTPDGSSAPSYATGAGPLVYWEPFDAPSGTNAIDATTTAITVATGRYVRFGNESSATQFVTPLDRDDLELSAWSVRNDGGLADLVISGDTDDIFHSLSWVLLNPGPGSIEVASLVLYRVRNAGAADGVLRLAFYANGLRRTVELAHDVTRHVVIPLGDQVIAPGGGLRVAAWPYGTDTVRELQLIKYGSETGNVEGAVVPLDAVADAVQTDVIGSPALGAEGRHTVAFIGRTL